jgi:hypothetical protein
MSLLHSIVATARGRGSRRRRSGPQLRRAVVEALERRTLLSVAIVVHTAADDDGMTTPVLNGGSYDAHTLRDAINFANAQGNATISFDPAVFSTPKTITLTHGRLVIGGATINGPGASLLIISGNHASSVLTTAGTNSISGMTITQGINQFGDEAGGINNNGTLALTNCIVSENAGEVGGGIANSGVLTLTNSIVTKNTAVSGGGVLNFGSTTLVASTVSGNSASQKGGGIRNETATGEGGSKLYIEQGSTVSQNTAGGYGGGISNSDPDAIVVSNSTISGNSAGELGGGIDNSGNMTVDHSTIAGNSAYDGGGIHDTEKGYDGAVIDSTISGNSAVRYGAGVYEDNSSLHAALYTSIIDCTINGNTSGASGGGVLFHADAPGLTFTLSGSIVSGNSEHLGLIPDDLGGDHISGDHDLIGVDNTYSFADHDAKGDLVGEDPKLGALGNYGGPTQTMPLLQGSPAIRAGAAFSYSYMPITTDQRGLSRPQSSDSDIGAFQSTRLVVNTVQDFPLADGLLSLRGAISLANAMGGDQTITFAPGLSGVIKLSGMPLELNDSSGTITIQGPTDSKLSIDGQGRSSVFKVDLGADAMIENLTITGGRSSMGGGVDNHGILDLVDCAVIRNTATDGGGIGNGGTLDLVNCTLSENTAVRGGGVYNQSSGPMAALDCTIRANSTEGADSGAGIFNANQTGAASLIGSIVSGNVEYSSGPLHPVPFPSGDDLDSGGGGFSGLSNLIGVDHTASFADHDQNGDLVGEDPMLGPLADNGGPTQTMATQAGSPAIHAGLIFYFGNAPVTLDQRSVSRMSGSVSVPDIGAYQNQGADSLFFAQGPISSTVGAAQSIVVNIEQGGRVLSGDAAPVTLWITGAPAGGTFSGGATSVTVNAAGGRATFVNVSFAVSGTYTLRATDPSDTDAFATISVSPVVMPPTQLVFAQPLPSALVTGQYIANPPVVVNVTQNGQIIDSDHSFVSLYINGVGPFYTVEAVHGVATFPNVAFAAAGTYTITAQDGNDTPVTSGQIVVTAPAANSLAFGPAPINAVAGSTISPGITVTQDQNGVPLADGSSVTLTLTGTTPSGGILNGTFTRPVGNNGVATFSDLVPSSAGIYKITATDGFDTSAQLSFNVTQPVSTILKFDPNHQPSSINADQPLATAGAPVVVDLTQNGTIVDDNSFVTLALYNGISPANFAAFAGRTTVQAVHGIATFDHLYLATVASQYTLQASDSNAGDIGATSSTFIVSPGAPHQVSLSGGVGVAGQSLSPPITAQLQDAYGNPIYSGSSDTITLSIGSGPPGAMLSGTLNEPLAGAYDSAPFDGVTLDKAGQYTLIATDSSNGNVLAGAAGVSITASTATRLAFVTQPGDTPAGAFFDPSVAVAVEDSLGNIVTSDDSPVTLSIASQPGSGAILAGAVTVNAINGVATFDGLSLGQLGTGYQLGASDGQYAAATSNPFNIIPPYNVYIYLESDGAGSLDRWVSTTPFTANPLGVLTPTSSEPIASDANLVVSGEGGNDFVTLDFSNGNFLQPQGPTFQNVTSSGNGLTVIGTGGNDDLTIDPYADSSAVGSYFQTDLSSFGNNAPIPLMNLGPAGFDTVTFLGGSGYGGSAGHDVLDIESGRISVNADAPSGTPNVSVIIGSGATAMFSTDQHLAALNINGGIATGAATRTLLGADSVSITGGGTLDLDDSELLTSTSPATIKAYLAAANDAAGNQDWSQPGLTSSIARDGGGAYSVAYAFGGDQSAQDAGITTHTGAPLGANQTLVRAVLTGDANMDGKVDFFDIAQILGYRYNTGGKDASYADGDLDYSGDVDFFDLSLILSANYNTGQTFWPAEATPPVAEATAAASAAAAPVATSPPTSSKLLSTPAAPPAIVPTAATPVPAAGVNASPFSDQPIAMDVEAHRRSRRPRRHIQPAADEAAPMHRWRYHRGS